MRSKILILLMYLLYSCSPSAEEQQKREQAIIDSVAQATKDSIQKAREHTAMEKAIADSIEAARAINDMRLIDLKAQLAGELEKLQSIRSPQFLRTPEEKAQQVANQTKVICNS